MKKLLIDVNSVVPYYVCGKMTGIGRTTLELVQELSKIPDIPFEIMLYSQNMKGIGGKNLETPFKTKHLYLPHRPEYDKWLQRLPVKECFTKYDLMHIPQNFEYVHCPNRTIVTLHDALFMKLQESAFNHNEMRETIPAFINKCMAIITCSENSKNDIVETMGINPDKIHVIPWGIRHDIFYPEPDMEKTKLTIEKKWGIKSPYFFSVSCNDERKNTHKLIDVYIKLSQNNLQNDLCLVWGAPEYIRKKVIENKLQNRIHFLDSVSNDDLRLLYAGATATVFPSLYEGFGLPVLESMACGTPVISSDTSSLPEVGGDAAIYINPENMDTLENALILFENNTLDNKSLQERSIKQASKFTWNKCAHSTISVYEKYLY